MCLVVVFNDFLDTCPIPVLNRYNSLLTNGNGASSTITDGIIFMTDNLINKADSFLKQAAKFKTDLPAAIKDLDTDIKAKQKELQDLRSRREQLVGLYNALKGFAPSNTVNDDVSEEEPVEDDSSPEVPEPGPVRTPPKKTAVNDETSEPAPKHKAKAQEKPTSIEAKQLKRQPEPEPTPETPDDSGLTTNEESTNPFEGVDDDDLDFGEEDVDSADSIDDEEPTIVEEADAPAAKRVRKVNVNAEVTEAELADRTGEPKSIFKLTPGLTTMNGKNDTMDDDPVIVDEDDDFVSTEDDSSDFGDDDDFPVFG